MSIFLELGQRPDEPGPPVHGRSTYPDDVITRLHVDAEVIVARYPQPRSALLPLLHLVQAEDGCLTPAGIAFCAQRLTLSEAEVTAVATFYSMYRRSPTGDYLVGVCTNTLCAVMGGDAILDALEQHLGVAAGQTTPDGRITLEHVECNAACDYAPVVMVNWEFFDNQTPSTARDLVDALGDGRPPAPVRGATPCTFRETARLLAGIDTASTAADSAGSDFDGGRVGDATLAGLRVARKRGMSAPEPGQGGAEPTDGAAPTVNDRRAAAEAVKDEPAPAPAADVPAESSGTEAP